MEAALAALPVQHRRHLIGTVPKYPKGITTAEHRLKFVAQTIRPELLTHYETLYHRSGGVVDWRIDASVSATVDLKKLWGRLSKKFPRALKGLKPTVLESDPPKLHKITKLPERIDLRYALWQKPYAVEDLYDTKIIQPITIQKIALREAPFSLELRHVAVGRQKTQSEIIATDIGFDL